jgi:hypothetical protein
MSFLLDALSKQSGPEDIEIAFRAYTAYLESVRHALPESAYEFATADWHYDHTDHRCPHDSWLEALTISEPALGSRREMRHVEIVARLLGAFHDGTLELSYPGVCSYSLSGASGSSGNAGHGDWLTDEIRLSEKNMVHHEIVFSNGSRWLIESKDIHFRWVHA